MGNLLLTHKRSGATKHKGSGHTKCKLTGGIKHGGCGTGKSA